ncbi:Scr1 family TA system antitoxin-like transcriptional regulator [Actinokineospora guangxiensis]|uniref:Scr1 family TA system antitoxin-like transcriptional regulator n=1 Tax=Actinokineospora guangxiensis TaxID=1490288 RepID=A0ABW0ERX1_9PSEU
MHRRVGSVTVAADQRTFLVEMAERDTITVSVIPGTTDLPPVAPFCLVHGTPSVAVETSRLTVHYATDPVTVGHLTHLAHSLTRRALSPKTRRSSSERRGDEQHDGHGDDVVSSPSWRWLSRVRAPVRPSWWSV